VRYYFGAASETINNYFYDLDEFFHNACGEKHVYNIYDTEMYSAQVWTAGNLKKQIATLDKAIAEIEASNDSEELKKIYIDHVRLVKTSPLSILLVNYLKRK
jgi:hypothetical protein